MCVCTVEMMIVKKQLKHMQCTHNIVASNTQGGLSSGIVEEIQLLPNIEVWECVLLTTLLCVMKMSGCFKHLCPS